MRNGKSPSTPLNINQRAALFEAYGHYATSRAPNRDEHWRKQIEEILNATDPPMLMARLEYAARGWPTFPAPADGAKKSLKSAKYSGGKNWGMTTNERTIRRDFKKWPNQNIGIVTGIESGIFVIDTDTKEHGDNVNGEATLREWEDAHGVLPDTLRARSPSESIHRFFRHPGHGIKIKNVAGILNGVGVDVRGDGGMVLGVPSYRPPKPATTDAPAKAGGAYVWVNEGQPIADAPQALLELVMEKPTATAAEDPINKKAQNFTRQGQTSSRKNSRRNRSWGETALDDECDKVASALKGKRNDQLNSSAFSLGQIIGGGSLNEDEVIEALMQAAEANGLLKDDGSVSGTRQTVYARAELSLKEQIRAAQKLADDNR